MAVDGCELRNLNSSGETTTKLTLYVSLGAALPLAAIFSDVLAGALRRIGYVLVVEKLVSSRLYYAGCGASSFGEGGCARLIGPDRASHQPARVLPLFADLTAWIL